MRPPINKKATQRVYFYHIGDIFSLKNDLQEFQESFSASDPLQNSIEHKWQLLKDTIQRAISKHIPSKLARHCDKLLWINPPIKQKMKLRKCLYDKVKQTNIYTDWCDYKKVRNKINSLLETIFHWVSSWLTKWCQRVVVDVESSDTAPVRSGVPQGTVLGPHSVYHNIQVYIQAVKVCTTYKFIQNIASISTNKKVLQVLFLSGYRTYSQQIH